MKTVVVIEPEDDVCTEIVDLRFTGVFKVRRATTVARARSILKGPVAAVVIITPDEQPPTKGFWPWSRRYDSRSIDTARSTLSELRAAGYRGLTIVHGLRREHLDALRGQFGDVEILSIFDGTELQEALGEQRADEDTLAELKRLGESIGRTLRNTERGVPDRMVDMFLRDVYGGDDKPSASKRLAELDPGDFRLKKAHDIVGVIDSMEAQARARDAQALDVVARRVRELSRFLSLLRSGEPAEPKA